MSRILLEVAINRMGLARRRTTDFIADLAADEWFWHPAEFTTHVAWQVGHVAVSQYNLCLRRVRGRTVADEALVSDTFIEHFKLGSKPVAGAENYPPLADIRRVLDAVHERALAELATRTDEELNVPVEQPHPVFKTKLGAVDYASAHEMVHAGQIALLRRLMGKPALR